MMDEQLLQYHRNEIQTIMQKKFCEKLFRSPEFPFLPSIGITHLFQSFEAKEHELGFIGILHVWYHEKLWETEWIDTPEKSMALISHLQKAKLYDEVKLVEIGIERMNQYAKKENMKVIRGHIDQYDNQDENIIIN